MVDIHKITELLINFSERYKEGYCPDLKVSDYYELFPTTLPLEKNSLKWPNKFPNFDKPGIYFILNQNREILYVGKASMNRVLEDRLGDYFRYDENKKCSIKYMDKWTEKPFFVATIGFDQSLSYESPCLEEYILKNIDSNFPDNKIGRKKT